MKTKLLTLVLIGAFLSTQSETFAAAANDQPAPPGGASENPAPAHHGAHAAGAAASGSAHGGAAATAAHGGAAAHAARGSASAAGHEAKKNREGYCKGCSVQ